MGYTHYWQHEGIDSVSWRLIAEHAHFLFDLAKMHGVALAREFDRPDEPPEINEAEIVFNGPGEQGHETFCLTRKATRFNFCKTAHKPYDKVVGLLLAYAMDVCPGFVATNDADVNYQTGEPLTKRLAL
jgi:hypothetical protein